MSAGEVGAVMQRTLYTVLLIGGPIIGATMAVGLVISIIQAATQINEATMTFVPKVLVTALLLMLFGPWMLSQLIDFTRYVFETAAGVGQ